ncbi:methyltransferase domain-containing protein [Streptomyces sp. NA04227]|uniref:methyltransferase domain-containing protein n=1 Tax=Streptomyces sp. NA04227 TaxID=2742136 RepID=UPI0015915F4D|nr:methyltransferase domain-containing protein [Streptomyces sp. NA04227]QKW09059.1 methyltransferase domain-containing protein [Streptomyces sp. NA04227]
MAVNVSELLACPQCKGAIRRQSDQAYVCTECSRLSPVVDGFVDMIREPGKPDPAAPTTAQKMMESKLYVSLYEAVGRPFFARLFAGFGNAIPSYAEEFRIYSDWLKLDESRGGAWLDLSCGGGYFTDKMAGAVPEATVVGLDISEEMLRSARKETVGRTNVSLVRGDVRGLPFADETFDGVNNPGSLHLYADPAAAYREVFRLLKPGGVYTASTFAINERTSSRLGVKATGIRRTDLSALPGELEKTGFVNYRLVKFGSIFAFAVTKP